MRATSSCLWTLLFAVLLWAGTSAHAQDELAESPVIQMRDAAAAEVLQDILTDVHYWDDTWQREFDGELYDEMRMKEVEKGFVPMVTGEADRDVPQGVVESAIFEHFEGLPEHTGLVKHVENLGRGHDPLIGADYVDTFLFLDATFNYVVFTWRIYKKTDDRGRTVLWFEKLTPEATDEATWARYRGRIAEIMATVDRRKAFGAVIEPEEVYGLFLLEPGQEHETRVLFVARLVFGKETDWLVRYASQMPFVLRVALGQTFTAAVLICYDLMDTAGTQP